MRIEDARTLLFVPGDRPERFAKALASGADAVIIDLEDAVAPDAKQAARASVAAAVAADPGAYCVRVNAAGGVEHERDVAALAPVAASVVAILLPKAERAEDAAAVHATLGRPVIAVVESACGLLAADRIASISGVVRLAFGAFDYALDVGAEVANDVLAYPRSVLAVASRAAGIAGPIDTPAAGWDDPDQLERDTLAAKRFGMTGKLCIHPVQLGPVARAFAPSEGEIAWARSVLAVEADGAVTALEGEMLDKPVFDRARRILSR